VLLFETREGSKDSIFSCEDRQDIILLRKVSNKLRPALTDVFVPIASD